MHLFNKYISDYFLQGSGFVGSNKFRYFFSEQYWNLSLLETQMYEEFHLLEKNTKILNVTGTVSVNSSRPVKLLQPYYWSQTGYVYHINTLANKMVTPMKHGGYFKKIHKRKSVWNDQTQGPLE